MSGVVETDEWIYIPDVQEGKISDAFHIFNNYKSENWVEPNKLPSAVSEEKKAPISAVVSTVAPKPKLKPLQESNAPTPLFLGHPPITIEPQALSKSTPCFKPLPKPPLPPLPSSRRLRRSCMTRRHMSRSALCNRNSRSLDSVIQRMKRLLR